MSRPHLKCQTTYGAVSKIHLIRFACFLAPPPGEVATAGGWAVRQWVGCGAWTAGKHVFRQIRAKQKVVIPAGWASPARAGILTRAVPVARECRKKQW